MNIMFINEQRGIRIAMARRSSTKNPTEGCSRRLSRGILYVERVGQGIPLLFLHGIGSNAESFAPLMEAFPSGPRLIAWNAPGYLSSAPLKCKTPKPADYAKALEQFMDGLGLERAHLIGHSLGTLIGTAFAVAAPHRVASLTLSASAQGYGLRDGEPLPAKAGQRLADLARLGPEVFAAERASRLIFEPERNASCVARVQQEMARINPEGYTQAVHMLSSGDLAASVARLKVEPAFIIGTEDQVTPPEQTERAMRAWADALGKSPRCIKIPCAGHALYVQAEAAFVDALIDLIPGLPLEKPHHAEGELHGG